MRLVVQRVKKASVEIEKKNNGTIGTGLLLYVGIEKNDSLDDMEFIANKVLKLRMFSDENNKMNKSIIDIKGEILSISQFTLASYLKKGRRPDFSNAKKTVNFIEDLIFIYKSDFNNLK